MTDKQQPTEPVTAAEDQAAHEAVAQNSTRTTEEAVADAARSHGNPATVVDPGSDLVDRDPAFVSDPPTPALDVFYAFAGAGMAGVNMTICSVCSALVKEDTQDNHTQWHRNGGA